ncbi:UNVERIFIED_CONTAM: transmembrane amino acid transporter protein [Hammondia hammondi]|eukprot:XP_008882113.1 transmembrane amino acid transporter protein [Hammondia hammondi]
MMAIESGHTAPGVSVEITDLHNSRDTTSEELQETVAHTREGKVITCLHPSPTDLQVLSSESVSRSLSCQDYFLATKTNEGAPIQHRHKVKSTGAFGTGVIICKAFMGSAFILLPYAVMKGGLIFSFLILAGVLVLSVYCMELLLECCEGDARATYEAVAEHALGRWGRTLVELCVFSSQVAFCSVYAVVASRYLRDVILVTAGCSPNVDVSVTTIIWCLGVYFFSLSFVRNMTYLVPLLLVGNMGTIFGMFILIVAVVVQMSQQRMVRSVELFNFDGWSLILGTSIYLWLGAGLILPIRNTAKPAVQQKFSQLLISSLTGLILLYVVYSTICVLAFGKDVREIILSNLPSGPLGTTIQAIFVIVVLSTYPLMLYPATGIVEERLLPYVMTSCRWALQLASVTIRIILVLSTLAMATLGKHQLGGLVSLIGAVCGVPLAFIFPALMHLKLRRPQQFLRRLSHYLIVLSGFAVQGFSVYSTISGWHRKSDYGSACPNVNLSD